MKFSLRLLSIGLGVAMVCEQASAQCLAPWQRNIWRGPAVQEPCCPPAPPYVAPTPVPPQAAPATPPQVPPISPEAIPQPPTLEQPTTPTTETPTPPEVNLSDLRAGAGRGETFAMASPQMMGDFGGFCAMRTVTVPITQTITTTFFPPPPPPPPPTRGVIPAVVIPPPIVTTTTVNSTAVVTVCDPLAVRAGSGFKIADNESPCPQDRVFVTYNYFDRLSGAPGFTAGGSVTTFAPQLITTTSTPNAFVAARNVNVNRELFGFESTFLGGDASVEVRVPIFQTTGNDTLNGEDFGDVTTIIKFALLHDQRCANCLSMGLAVTAPTGPNITTVDGTIHDVLLQPFVGGLWSSGNFFVQGFSSVVVPTDSRDVLLLFNDVSVGYSLYRGSRANCLSYIAPALECHVTTPLNHRDASSPISIPDIVDLEPALYLGFGERLLLSVGLAVPVSGPQPFNVEALAQLNFRF